MANAVAWGFLNLQDIFDRRVSDVGVGVVEAAIAATLAEHNRMLNTVFGLFVRRTTDFKTKYRTATGANLQALDQNGRALPIRPFGQYEISLPLQRAGTAWGYNFETGIKMTVGESSEAMNVLTMADVKWMRNHILAALYANAAWTFPDEEHGDLSIVGLANGDTTIYPILSGNDAGATANHYFAQAAAIADATNPYPILQAALETHAPGGQVIALIPTGLKATTQALLTFHTAADPNLRTGSGLTELVGQLGVAVPGTVIGYEDSGVWVVEWPSLPANYIIGVTTAGERPIAMREDTYTELQGFKAVAIREDHPWWEQQFLRKAGFGAWNRVGATVTRIGSASYTAAPTGYASMLS